VAGLQPGDEVFGIGRGAFGEYVRATEAMLARKPVRLSFEEAASIPVAAVTALQALRDRGRLAAGQTLLINGASGGVGTFAVQLAKAMGAEVTGVCSTRHVELVRSLGADHVFDYTGEDFTGSGRRYELVVNCAEGRSLRDLRRRRPPRAG
jgi:NADPH:quinone reductase-like Zn-dependent oxidoreductase